MVQIEEHREPLPPAKPPNDNFPHESPAIGRKVYRPARTRGGGSTRAEVTPCTHTGALPVSAQHIGRSI